LSFQDNSATSLVTRSSKEKAFVERQRLFLYNEINPFGICEMSFGREIWLRHVKCAAASEILNRDVAAELYNQCGTIRRILIASINTAKGN